MSADLGTLVVSRHSTPGIEDRITIDHADPTVEITDELLGDIKAGLTARFATWNERAQCVTFHGENRRVIYRTVEYRALPDTWLMQWPD